MAPKIASTAREAEAWESSAFCATCSMSFVLFTLCPPIVKDEGNQVPKHRTAKTVRSSYNKRVRGRQVDGSDRRGRAEAEKSLLTTRSRSRTMQDPSRVLH